MKILMIGDVVGKPGRRVLRDGLPGLRERHQPDLTVVNAENAAGGCGVTASVLDELLGNPQIDVLTSGNHIWDKPEALQLIDGEPRLLRPHNYPEGTPGQGWLVVRASNGIEVGVLNIMGAVCMHPAWLWSIFTPRRPAKRWPWAGIWMVGCRWLSVPTHMWPRPMSAYYRTAPHTFLISG